MPEPSVTRRVTVPSAIRRAVAAFAIAGVAAGGLLMLAWPAERPIDVNVRWSDGLPDADRLDLERKFQLTQAVRLEGATWIYRLTDTSTDNIRAIVQSERVADTHHLDRANFRPELAQNRPRRILLSSVAIAVFASMTVLVLPAWYRRSSSQRASWWLELKAVASLPVSQGADAALNPLTMAGAVAAGGLAAAAMAWFAQGPFWSFGVALAMVFAGGYVVGSLLLAQAEGMVLAVIRTTAGLMLTSIAFLASLVLGLPWLVVPCLLFAAVVVLRRQAAFVLPRPSFRVGLDGLVAGGLVLVLLLPILITFAAMTPGAYPPVLYNVDTAYSLEKTHALTVASSFPPPSLSNVGVQRTYHYGTQAMAAMLARGSGLRPHHALFLIVLPLLTAAVVAAAIAVARLLAPGIPRSVTVPLLLLSIPSLSGPFWDRFGPQVQSALTSSGSFVEQLVGNVGLWGILSNEGQNVGGDFLILASVAGIAAAPVWGWWLAAFCIGSSLLFKTTVGIALVAGFGLAELWRAGVARRLPAPQLLVAVAVFAVVAGLFFVTSFESHFRLEVHFFEHLREIAQRGGVRGFGLDALWLFLPALIVLSAGLRDPERRSAPYLIMALTPLVIVNTTRLVRTGEGGAASGDFWVQIPHAVPFMAHAFVLSLAGWRWTKLGAWRRTAVTLALALAIAPVVVAAGHYSQRLLRDPSIGNEYVDNRSIAEALAVIPAGGSMVVTNDLRYPADSFSRNDRQMQIPALFGHQAYAVNFSYEPVEERRDVQNLLQQPEWSAAIADAARTHHWTHFIVRKDYVHPAPIPLPQIFENDAYVVFRFP